MSNDSDTGDEEISKTALDSLADSDRESAWVFQWFREGVENGEVDGVTLVDDTDAIDRGGKAVANEEAESVSEREYEEGEQLTGQIMAHTDRFTPDVLEGMTVAAKRGLLDELRDAEDGQ